MRMSHTVRHTVRWQIRMFEVAYFASLASKMVLYELSGTVSGVPRVLAGLGGYF